jgi:hypothetical protein
MLLLSLVLLVIAGCRQTDRATSVAPTHAELPTFERLEPTLPIVVGVEGAAHVPRTIIVPRFEEIELTPEEREALGQKELPLPDVLALHRPPRRPEHGVSAESFRMFTGIGGVGGALVGRDIAYPRVATHGVAGRYAYQQMLARSGASVGLPRHAGGHVGRSWSLSVGETSPRSTARSAPRAER